MVAAASWSEIAQERQRPGNPRIVEPSPPGAWVNATACRCGARYRAHRTPGLSFGQARAELVAMGAPYLSRGPVLWWMHVSKLIDWYAEHTACGVLARVTPAASPTCDPPPAGCGCVTRCPWCPKQERPCATH